MTIKRNLWKPDTCDCEIEYEWDDSVTEASRVHTPVSIKRCSVHNDISVLADSYNTLLSENTRKNIVSGLLKENLAQGEDDIREKYKWSFTGEGLDRVLRITFDGLTPTQKLTLQSLADNRFGANKAVVE